MAQTVKEEAVAGPARAGVALEGLSKRFGDVEAVRQLDLEIREGEFFSLLGPSGCGKTTTLRLIAGFEEPTTGRIVLGGKDVTDTPPHRRPVNTVFQNYALFPHLNVRDNVAFGLRFQNVERQDRDRRVERALALVRMERFAKRKPAQLSGGEQQRVAIARAMALRPPLVLADEPTGNLDSATGAAIIDLLLALNREHGSTLLLVTHDEALAQRAHRAIGLRDGRLVRERQPTAVS